jgi:nicotinate-nucleotide pyrophosphorylase (carboxylating)
MSTPKTTLDPGILETIRRALEEDIGSGDATSESILPPEAQMTGQVIAKQEGVIAGLEVARAAYALFDPQVSFQAQAADGDPVEEHHGASAGMGVRQVVALVSGPARSLLTVERTALNFLGRMSGIATLTRRYVDAVAGTQAVILDTRKTAPGLRIVDKLAVRLGGGRNHRVGLYDMILIKDNHVDFAGSLTEAVRRARAAHTGLEIEVEARTLADVEEALACGVERILLDNMPVEMMAEAVQRCTGRARLEASGNVNLDTVRRIAETGVDFISVGALTHSAPVLDLSFDYLR